MIIHYHYIINKVIAKRNKLLFLHIPPWSPVQVDIGNALRRLELKFGRFGRIVISTKTVI